MGWVLRLVKNGAKDPFDGVDVLEIDRPEDLGDLADLGLTLSQGKHLLAGVQQAVVAARSRDHAARRPKCRTCGVVCQLKDYRPHQIATLYGAVTVRRPRFHCAGCGGRERGVGWPSHCRSTPELDQLRAHLSALMPYRIAAGVLEQFLPVDAGNHPETLRGHTLKRGAELVDTAAAEPATAAPAITLSVDSTCIRSCEDGHRHLEVRLGNVETAAGARQVFAAVAKTDTQIEALIRRSLKEIGQTADTTLTAFTDGCPGLRAILAEAGIAEPPFLDRFHIAMRLEHAGKTAGNLSSDTPEQERAKAVIVKEVDRLRWRIWHGKASDARITLERLRELMPAFRSERGRGSKSPPARRLWTALHEIDRYLSSQSTWLINYAGRHGVGQRVGTSITEGTANFLVNRRMNKSQQMRWSRRGADLLLQVRCAVVNGKLGSGLGHLFDTEAESASGLAMAA
jgi:hypothetical protein